MQVNLVHRFQWPSDGGTNNYNPRNCRIELELAGAVQYNEPISPVHSGSTQTEATNRTAQAPLNPDPSPGTIPNSGISFLSIISALAIQACYSLQTITRLGAQLLVPYLYLPFFVRLPSYYASEASALLGLADQSISDYEKWLDARGVHTSSLVAPTASSILRAGPEVSRSPPPPSSSAICLDERNPLPQSVLQLQKVWEDYIEACLEEWKVLLKVACILFTFVSEVYSSLVLG